MTNAWRIGRFVFMASPMVATLVAATTIAMAVTSTLTVLTTGLVVSTVPEAVHQGMASPAGARLLWSLAAFGLVATATVSLAAWTGSLTTRLHVRTAEAVERRVMDSSLNP